MVKTLPYDCEYQYLELTIYYNYVAPIFTKLQMALISQARQDMASAIAEISDRHDVL